MDGPPKGEEEWCPGLLTSSASSSSLFSPSSPPRVRRGIKTQLLRGMQGGGGRKAKRGGKQSTKISHSDETFTFPLYNIHTARDLSALPPRSDFPLDCDHSVLSSPVLNTHNHISLFLTSQAGVSPPLLPFHFLLLLFCPSNKSIENQPNPAGGKPAYHDSHSQREKQTTK